MIEIQNCPVCNSTELSPIFTVVDHTVSHETFNVSKCEGCTLLITTPRPENSDLGKYYESPEYISHSQAATSAFDSIYLTVRRLTTQWKVKLVSRYDQSSGRSILDYGCGTGTFLRECQTQGWKISGVEPAEGPRQLAAKQLKQPVPPALQTNEDLYNLITLWHVLEHIPNVNEILTELVNRLKETGTIFIAVPNHMSHDALKYKQTWAALDVPRHLWHFNRRSMKLLLEKHGLSLIKVVPMKFDSFYVSMLSEKNLRKNSGISWFLYGLIAGLRSNLSARRTKEFSSLIYIARKN